MTERDVGAKKQKSMNTGKIFLLAFSLYLGIVTVATKEVLEPSFANGQGAQCLYFKINFFSLPNILLFISVTILTYLLLRCVLSFLQKTNFTVKKNEANHKKIFFSSFFLNLIVYGIWFLEYFPGTGMNDTINALISPVGSPLQPIAYQCFIYYAVEGFTRIFGGNYIYGYACVTFLQLLLMSASIAWVITWMAKKNIRRGIVYFFMVFYAIFPAFGDYSITLVKDVPFGLCTMLFTVLLYEIISTKGDNLKHPLTMAVFSGLMIILCCVRSNGGIMIFLTAIILLLFEKENRTRLVVTFIPVIIITIVLAIAEDRTGGSEVSFRESIGVPIAQIGATLNVRGKISHEEREVLEQIIPLSIWKDNYRFSFVDNVKFNSEFNNKWLNENKGVFLKTWASILRNNFPIYVRAYLFHSYGFWNISPYNRYATDYTQSYFTRINNNTNDDSYWGTFISAIGLKNQNIFPESVSKSLDSFFNRYFRGSLAFGPGMMIAIVFACLALILCMKKWKIIISFLPCILVWLTMMVASPGSLIYRYSFYLLLSLPCFLAITIKELAHG